MRLIESYERALMQTDKPNYDTYVGQELLGDNYCLTTKATVIPHIICDVMETLLLYVDLSPCRSGRFQKCRIEQNRIE